MAGLFGGSAPVQNPTLPPQHGAAFNTLDGLLGGWLGYGGRAQAKQASRVAAAEEEAAFQARIASQFGGDPVAMIAARANPEEFGKNLASGYGAANVEGGSSRVYGNPARGGSVYTAPKLVADAGIFGTQTPTGYAQTGARGPSIAEAETATHNRASEDAALTPEGFLPRKDETGKIVGFDLDPGYGGFAKEKAAAGATRVSVPITLPAQNKFAEAFATQYATDLSGARSDAERAQQSLTALQEASKLMASGNVITGAAAGPRLQANKWGALMGNEDARAKVGASEVFQNQMSQQVLAIAKQLGTGGAISEGDRKFAERLAGGDLNLDGATLNRLIQIQQSDAQNRVGKFKRMGTEAFSSVPSAQGLPQSAFTPAGGSGASPTRRRYNPATGRLE